MLTDKEKRFANKLKRYFENEDEYNYKSTIRNAILDKKFENLIIDMTVARISGGSSLAKYKYKFDYKPKPIEEDE